MFLFGVLSYPRVGVNGPAECHSTPSCHFLQLRLVFLGQLQQTVIIPWVRDMHPLVSVLPEDLKLLLQVLLQIAIINQFDKTLLFRPALASEVGLHPGEACDDACEMSASDEGRVCIFDQKRSPFREDYTALKESLVEIKKVLPLVFFRHSSFAER